MDELRRIVRKTTTCDSTNFIRSVFVWGDTGVEIKEGLYIAKVRSLAYEESLWVRSLYGRWKREVLVWKNQEPGEIHVMVVKNKITIPDIGEFSEPGMYEFYFEKEYLGIQAWKYLFSR
jgi:hypothetical protein